MSEKICNIAGVLVLLLAANSYRHCKFSSYYRRSLVDCRSDKGLVVSMNLSVSNSPPIDVCGLFVLECTY